MATVSALQVFTFLPLRQRVVCGICALTCNIPPRNMPCAAWLEKFLTLSVRSVKQVGEKISGVLHTKYTGCYNPRRWFFIGNIMHYFIFSFVSEVFMCLKWASSRLVDVINSLQPLTLRLPYCVACSKDAPDRLYDSSKF